MLDWIQLIIFSLILLFLVRGSIQTKSLKTSVILLAGIGVIVCKLFLNDFESQLVQIVMASTTLLLCIISGWLIIRKEP